ncbi:hypothetical protein [Bosea sp. (in: a-proteobacteria)]|uniref:hypothetical protein n=1 Tax=Bosea sp. (in: a-proteobacteria) TaxID=1871050 RepID=UPI0026154635|nr:hypothetical protein [Bosea sp. (in: a-proteobacteria)]MCO5091966.1 hypothetical protein [Bosea sp. (in: a-proteobacteria)]
MADDQTKSAPPGKTWLTLHWDNRPQDEISVVHSEYGSPIPFGWIDHETLEIDDVFAGTATIKHTPKPPRNYYG